MPHELEVAKFDSDEPGRRKSNVSSMYSVTDQDTVIYDSNNEVPGSFWRWSVCWCGCCDPTYYITDATVQANICEGCGRTVDSLLFDNIWDVTREQSCCCYCWGNCCSWLDDVGDIVLYCRDGQSAGQGEYRLKNVFRSKEIFDKLAEIIQDKHAGFRLNQRNVGKGVQNQKKKVIEGSH